MSALDLCRRLLGCRRGATAVEFAFIAPLLIGFTGAIFEVILMAYDFNLASEATRRGVRVALIQSPIASVANVGTTPLVCTGTVSSVSCPGVTVSSPTTFTSVVSEMKAIKKDIANVNVQVTYSMSGLDDQVAAPGIVTPLVTVKLTGIRYNFRLLALIPGAPDGFDFPAFAASAVAPARVT